MNSLKAVTQRHFQTHLKEIDHPVEVTLQQKGTGTITTIGYFFPKSATISVERTTDGTAYIIKTQN